MRHIIFHKPYGVMSQFTPAHGHRSLADFGFPKGVYAAGRNRQVRRMLAAVGFPVVRLVHAAIGPLTLAGLTPGEWRELTAEEMRKI